jgi:hypothetical protein
MDGKTLNNTMRFFNSVNFFKLKPTPGNICFLGIASIALSWIYGIPGIILGRYALQLHQRIIIVNSESMDDGTNTCKLKNGRIYAIVGLALSYTILFGTVLVLFLSLIG